VLRRGRPPALRQGLTDYPKGLQRPIRESKTQDGETKPTPVASSWVSSILLPTKPRKGCRATSVLDAAAANAYLQLNPSALKFARDSSPGRRLILPQSGDVMTVLL
jgi:hypothetical protein